MTKLEKTIVRETEINGERYVVSLDPQKGFVCRKSGKKKYQSRPFSTLADGPIGSSSFTADQKTSDMMAMLRLKALIGISTMPAAEKAKCLTALKTLTDTEEFLK